MKIKLAYGKTGLEIEVPEENTTIIEPVYVRGLEDERKSLIESLRNPVDSPPLFDLVKPNNKVAIVFSDITRPCPSNRILPPVLEEIKHVSSENIVLINATGMHRENTSGELSAMLGRDIVNNYRIINHDSRDKQNLTYLGDSTFGTPIWVNTEFIKSDIKILTGFIEPHIFAGYSGGPKAILPGISGSETVMANHGAKMIANSNSTWGITYSNPIWEDIREVALVANPMFIVNVTLNKKREITGVFSGKMMPAHEKGIEFVAKSALRPVSELFDIVITTNSGYPLDINLYQTVKGMSAASRIVREGGSIIVASECVDGVPEFGCYRELLHSSHDIQEIYSKIMSGEILTFDQWEVQIQAKIQKKARIFIYSTIHEEEVKKAHLEVCHNIEETIDELLGLYGEKAKIAVLPEGPMTIPYLK